MPEVCVVGNLLIDLVIRGLGELPAWGREVDGDDHFSVPSGQAALLAQALGALGVHVRVVCTVGDDPAGREIVATLASADVDVGAIETSAHRPTGLSVVLVRTDGERAFASAPAALYECDEAMVLRHWETNAAPIVCFVGLNNLPSLGLDAVQRLLRRARAEGRRTVLDTGWDTGQWQPATVKATRALLADVDVFLPNLEEASALTGFETAEAAAAELADDGAGIVIVKCGAAGSYAQQGSDTFTAPSHAVEVVDTVGAGDVFNAGFLHGYLPAGEIDIGLRRGNAAAALYVSRSTRRFPSLDEVLALAAGDPYGISLTAPTARSDER